MNIAEIAQAVDALDKDKAVALVNEALEKGLDPVAIMQEGVVAGLKTIGDKFGAGEYFLAELMIGAKVSEACIAIISPHLPKDAGPKRGVVVLGTVQGDIHDIGTGILARQLQISGYEVHNLGINVPSMVFIDKAKETKADIIGMSAFVDSSRPYFKEVIAYLRDTGLRDRYKVLIGGATASPEVAESLGADGWAPNAPEAVTLCDRLLGHSA